MESKPTSSQPSIPPAQTECYGSAPSPLCKTLMGPLPPPCSAGPHPDPSHILVQPS